ncbi:MAG TPA: hypothetical protein VGN00_13105 [Puia sp.]|jgi:hypothetical protein
MNYNKAIYTIFFIFLGAIFFQIVIIFIALLSNYFDAPELEAFLISVLKIYSIHLSMLFAGTFFSRLSARHANVDRKVFSVAVILSSLWNLLLVSSLLILMFITQPRFDVIIKFQEDIASNSAFLITGVLAYFFVAKKTNG